jgi:Mg2+-importing ATPase
MAKGADGLSKQHVVVKQLSAMNDLGNITVLCTDKTGTLTENILQIVGISSGDTLKLLAFALASNEGVDEKSKQLVSSFDQAFQSYATADARTEAAHFKKIKELPFDPNDRKRRAILQDQRDNSYYLVNIGSAETLLAASSSDRHDQYAQEIVTDGLTGLRHLAFSYAKIDYGDHFDIAANETNLQFLGFAKMVDPLRPSTKETLDKAKKLGISIKILTGDSKEVAEYVGREVGLLGEGSRVYTGEEIEKMSDDELRKILPTTSIFAKVTPTQKYAIIKLLKEKDVVGYQGDGINDAPSLKLADVGIAVNNASDVAKDSADILLLNPDLGVIINGIRFGRTIFVNINKYITYTMVGNFGNFFALAGLFLVSATLPLLAVQLLLSSLITDFPLVAIATDSVNDSEVLGPSKFDIHKLMLISLVLGGVTTLVEFMFFAHFRLSATPRTNTLIFLFLTLIQLAVIICVRSKGYFWTAKRPSWQLTAGILTVTAISVLAPYVTPIAHIFSFVPLPPLLIAEVLVITLAYVALMDTIKVWFYQATAVHAAH